MPRFKVLYDFVYYNGAIIIEADDADKAVKQLRQSTYRKLRQYTEGASLNIESVEEIPKELPNAGKVQKW